jgi:acyl-coenzyme A synthetase/AMP-(fatty) acid ligase
LSSGTTAARRRPASSDPRGDGTGAPVYRTGDLAHRDADGVLHFAGRRDAQIKSRGYRIELGEIEAAIASLGAIAQCAVVAIPAADFAGTAICCAWTPAPGSAPDLLTVRASLRELLPAYMLPSKWRRLDALPTNGNGKIDRPALARLFAEADGSRSVP